MKSKRGEIASSTLIIIIAVLILVSGFLYGYLNQLDILVSDSYRNAHFTETSLTKGFEIIAIDGYDGRNNGFDEFYLTVRLLPDSDEIDFTLVNILVKTHNWSGGLAYRNGTLVQNDSGYAGYVNGTGYFQIDPLITSNFHRPDHMVRGETVKIYVHLPYTVPDSNQVGFNIIAPTGVSYPITAFTGDTIPAMEQVRLFPRI